MLLGTLGLLGLLTTLTTTHRVSERERHRGGQRLVMNEGEVGRKLHMLGTQSTLVAEYTWAGKKVIRLVRNKKDGCVSVIRLER
jgi:hypothetical protein